MSELSDCMLVEWAARAAGLTLADPEDAGIPSGGIWIVGRKGYDEVWNPLNEDRDAFRLAVKLGISIYADDESYVFAVTTEQRQAETADPEGGLGWCECWNNNRYSATRRAIVRAAAQIGQAMPNG